MKFKVGDYVYTSDGYYGKIVAINNTFDMAQVEFDTGSGGGNLPYDFNELKMAPLPD